MRRLARIGCTLAGVALLAPAVVRAQEPASSTAPAPAADAARAPAASKSWLPGKTSKDAAKPHKHRRSLFGGERLCVECQRAEAKAKTGVEVPPPPAMPVPGRVVNAGACAVCGTDTDAVATHTPYHPPGAVHSAAPAMADNAPGHAVVGDEAPGLASTVGGPAPIGMFPQRLTAHVPAPAAARGSRDGDVMASSYSPSFTKPEGANRPHVISHLLGVSGIGREAREARARRSESAHASIPYGTQSPTVTELPASAVYGK